jgi:hypothetical protein
MSPEQHSRRKQQQRTPAYHKKRNTSLNKKKDCLCPESIAMENPEWIRDPEFPDNQTLDEAPESIAMQNPKWIPEPDFPDNRKLDEAMDGYLKPRWRPFHLLRHIWVDDIGDMNRGPGIQDKSRHHNVASSERPALRSQRNQQFHDLSHARSSKDNNKDIDDCSGDVQGNHVFSNISFDTYMFSSKKLNRLDIIDR